jgi:UDP-N-acetylmuramoyl-tripeptide--D-alanyl-D-alanine ligase
MRQNIYDFHGITIIDDCYNASLESVLAALGVLAGTAKKTKGRAIAVLSDILETGEYSKMIHESIGNAIAGKNIDIAFTFGKNSKVTHDAAKQAGGSINCMYFNEKSDIARVLYEMAKKGDTILFKASRGMALETVVDDFKGKFN